MFSLDRDTKYHSKNKNNVYTSSGRWSKIVWDSLDWCEQADCPSPSTRVTAADLSPRIRNSGAASPTCQSGSGPSDAHVGGPQSRRRPRRGEQSWLVSSGDHIWALMQEDLETPVSEPTRGAFSRLRHLQPMAVWALPQTPSVFKVMGSSGVLAPRPPHPDCHKRSLPSSLEWSPCCQPVPSLFAATSCRHSRDFLSPWKAPLARVLSDSPVTFNFSLKLLVHFCWNPLSSQCDARTFHIIFFFLILRTPGGPQWYFYWRKARSWDRLVGGNTGCGDQAPPQPLGLLPTVVAARLPPRRTACSFWWSVSAFYVQGAGGNFHLPSLVWITLVSISGGKMTAFYNFGRSRLFLQ